MKTNKQALTKTQLSFFEKNVRQIHRDTYLYKIQNGAIRATFDEMDLAQDAFKFMQGHVLNNQPMTIEFIIRETARL